MSYKICAITTISKTMDWFLVDTMRFLSKNGFEVSLICDMENDFIERNKNYANLLPIKMARGIDPIGAILAIIKLYKIFKKEKFDLIQYSTPNASLYASIAAVLAGIEIRVYSQWGIRYISLKGAQRLIFKKIEKLICSLSTQIQPDSFGNLTLSIKEKLYEENKGLVIWRGSASGVNFKKFNVLKKERWRAEIRENYGINADDIVFGFVGRLDRDKGINELLEAYRKILAENPNSFLILVGRADKTKTLDQSLYKWSKEEPNVLYCGETFSVEKYLAAMDIFLLPSYREGFGSSVIEAEAMQIPVIITDIPGPTEAIQNMVTGITVKKGNVDELIAAMLLLINDKNKREKMGKAGLAFVTENFESNLLFKHILEDRKRLLFKN